MNDREFDALLARSSLGTKNAQRLIREGSKLCGIEGAQRRIDEINREDNVTAIAFKTRYIDEPDAIIRKGHYHDGSTALQIFDQFGEVLTTATVCLSASDEIPDEGCVFIKEHGENEGTLAALQAAGIVGPSLRALDAGFVGNYAYECELLVEVANIV